MIIAVQLSQTDNYTNDDGKECTSVYTSFLGVIDGDVMALQLFADMQDVMLIDGETGKIIRDASVEVEV